MIINDLPLSILDEMTDEIPVEKGTVTYKTNLGRLAGAFSVSRPNILDNPFFTINQKKKTYVKIQNGYSTGDNFIKDRWHVYAHNVKGNGTASDTTAGKAYVYVSDCNSEDICLHVGKKYSSSTNEGYIEIVQAVPDYISSRLIGKGLTLSANTSSGVKVLTCDLTSSTGGGFRENNFAMFIAWTSQHVLQCHLRLEVNSSQSDHEIYINAAKLEIGYTSTLLYDPKPDPSVELIKCQRFLYFLPVVSSIGYVHPVLIGQAISADQVRFYVRNSTAWCYTPTIIEWGYDDGITYRLYDALGNVASINSFVINSVTDDYKSVIFAVNSSGLTANRLYTLQSVGPGTLYPKVGGLMFSCEI